MKDAEQLTEYLRQAAALPDGKPYLMYFEEQRKNIGKSYALANKIRELSKAGIAALKEDRFSAAVPECREQIAAAWKELRGLQLPISFGDNQDRDTGQEMVEFLALCEFYPMIREPELWEASLKGFQMPSAAELGVQPQTWLAGLGDSVGELGKMIDESLCTKDLGLEDRLAIRERFLTIGKGVYAFLDRYETCYGMVIDNSHRPGYAETFRGLLGRVRGAIKHHEEAVIRIYDELSLRR